MTKPVPKNSSAINAALTGLNYVSGMNSVAMSYGTMQGKNALALGLRYKVSKSNFYKYDFAEGDEKILSLL